MSIEINSSIHRNAVLDKSDHSHNDERQWIGHSHAVKQMREIPENST